MRHCARLIGLIALQAVLAQGVAAETVAYNGKVSEETFFRFIEEHSGDAVKLSAEGQLPEDQMEKTEEGVFFWLSNVQVGVEPAAFQGDKIAINGCYRVRLAEVRQGVTAYYLDPSSDCAE
jgi:hypothetical protein